MLKHQKWQHCWYVDSGLRMRNFTWNRFPIKNLLIDSLLTPIVESTYFLVCSMKDLRRFIIRFVILLQCSSFDSFKLSPLCQAMSYAAFRSRNTEPTTCLSWNACSIFWVRRQTWSAVDLFLWKRTLPCKGFYCLARGFKREVCSESMTKFSSIQFFVRNVTISR